jgi:hypothetical protein
MIIGGGEGKWSAEGMGNDESPERPLRDLHASTEEISSLIDRP